VPVIWDRSGPVGVALIDRPERRNALSAELCDELLTTLVENRDLGAVVIGGTGSKAFCAGADLGRRADDLAGGGLEHGGGDRFRPAFDALLDAIVAYPAPVIAAVNGAALGAGMQLAIACDLRVVAPHATFGIPAGKLGVVLSAPNIHRLALVVGQATARDVLLTARVLDVDAAERVGLVQRRGPDAVVSARALAEEIAALAPLSVRSHKQALNAVAAAADLDEPRRAMLASLEAQAFASDDLQEGLAAFSEKRPPRFEGR
jgi:enoyl-CoA hydratase/carnithine racemase